MHDSDGRIITIGDRPNLQLALQYRVRIIQDRVDGVRGIAIARKGKNRRALANFPPIFLDRPLACAALFNWNSFPGAKIGGGGIRFQNPQIHNCFGLPLIQFR